MKHKKLAIVAFGLTAICSLILAGARSAADTGLLDAVRSDDKRAVNALLKAGADPNTRDDIGATGLMHAAAFSSPECGSDPRPSNNRMTSRLPRLAAVTSAVVPSLIRALTAAPQSSNSRTFAVSPVAHMRGVAPPLLDALMSAPASSKTRRQESRDSWMSLSLSTSKRELLPHTAH